MTAEQSDVSNDILETRNERVRNLFYKKPIKKDNYKLDLDDEACPQEVRRQQLLAHQKKSRDAVFNAGRAILETALDSEEENLEEMEVCKQSFGTFQRCRQYANKLMLSEWMLEVPEDYLEKWLLIPCPEGRRTLIVACKAEFRMFWLKSQFDDTKELQARNTPWNTFPILPLPGVACNENTSEFMEKVAYLEPLDGILFFHREGHYTSGRTPLVTWLKTFMLHEVLGISVSLSLDKKPDKYIDFQHYIQALKPISTKKIIDNEMDVQDIDG